ncbi:MAG TPA: RagB/SusD family nutrient uptake outer membrane protein, partial [Balneolales bacterium]|nr:RagB/SusD family nutrient uptake outer membrane protein [Balneolales bacterium]
EAWSDLYVGVHRANLVLDNVPAIKMDSNLKARLLGEAHFLRGYYYFQLVKLFGGVPLILKSELTSYTQARATKDQVYQQIIKDFQAADQVLPLKSQYPTNDMGRATKGAADSYLGKVYLYMHKYTEAEKWFKKVIDSGQYSLDPNYLNMFRLSGQHGSGSIFEVNYVYSTSYDVTNRATVAHGSRAMYGWGFVCPTQDLASSFAKGDPREKETIYANGDTLSDGQVADVGNSPTGYMNRKAYLPKDEFPPNGSAQSSGRDEVLMRLGKVLLWYAEAANEDGHTQAALTALNKVRARARQGNPNVLPDITETNKDSLRKIIWHEERDEYALEHERFFDLVRTGRAASVFHAYAQKYNTTKGKNYKAGVNEVFPLPENDISLSDGKLKQNQGY